MKLSGRFEGPWEPTGIHALPLKTGDWRYQRPVNKEGKCGKCGTCHLFCTTGCIEEHPTRFEANLDYCKGCGLCAAVCPNNAIFMVLEERE